MTAFLSAGHASAPLNNDTREREQVALHIEAAVLVAVVGRSGCGKSTLLRPVAGLESADKGCIAFDKEASLSPEIRILFQDSRLQTGHAAGRCVPAENRQPGRMGDLRQSIFHPLASKEKP